MSVTIHKTVGGREFVRTPDECFEDLPDFPYAPVDDDDEGPQHVPVGQ